jgi:hypothetical protein
MLFDQNNVKQNYEEDFPQRQLLLNAFILELWRSYSDLKFLQRFKNEQVKLIFD